jgi:hypothetical protein
VAVIKVGVALLHLSVLAPGIKAGRVELVCKGTEEADSFRQDLNGKAEKLKGEELVQAVRRVEEAREGIKGTGCSKSGGEGCVESKGGKETLSREEQDC